MNKSIAIPAIAALALVGCLSVMTQHEVPLGGNGHLWI